METMKEERPAKARLIIFGCGYVGTAFAQRALVKGWEVCALTRNAQQAEELRTLGLSKVVTAELHGTDWHEEFTGDYDYCLNCVSSAGGGLDGYRLSYLEGMRSIRRWAEGKRVGTLVYTSSSSVYPQTGGVWVNETCGHEGVSASGEILLQSEGVAMEVPMPWERAYVLRLSGIYGPGRHMLLDQLRAGEQRFNGRGEHYLNLIHRDDVVGALDAVFASTGGHTSGVYNLSDGHPYPKIEVVQWLAEQVGAQVPLFTGEPGDGPRALLFRKGPMPSRCISNKLLQERFGWTPRYPDFKAGYAALLSGE